MKSGDFSMDRDWLAAPDVGDGFSPIDLYFARFIQRFCHGDSRHVVLAAALVSRCTREGHICLDLADYAGERVIPSGQQPLPARACPKLAAWIEDLQACSAVGLPGDYTPLVLDASRLYLWRYWDYEQTCARRLLHLSRQRKTFDAELFRKDVQAVFSPETGEVSMEQKLSALAALRSGLCVITGGPGTGKTTLVSKILSLLVHQDSSLRVALAAPTGKAARRVGEAVAGTVRFLSLPDGVKAQLPVGASTIHRLLGITPSRALPRYHENNPLLYDVVVIDEASMVDLALMAKLLKAVRPSARLILLGDKDQLASVQAGHVLGDICDTGAVHGYSKEFADEAGEILGAGLEAGGPAGIQDSVIELDRTYRFTPDSGIYRLSRSVNRSDVAACMEIVASQDCGDIRIHESSGCNSAPDGLQSVLVAAYFPYLRAEDPGECLDLFDSFRVLCALREGPFGVIRMNAAIERLLAANALIEPSGQYYHGRPVIVTANDYTLRLFNGDVGIILRDRDEKDLRAYFPTPEGAWRKVPPVRLPQHETAYAMTVHKSQGSEFDHVLLMLPDRDSPVLTRELVYTGITRARKRLDICMDRDVFATAVARRTQRTSGLHGLLWKPR